MKKNIFAMLMLVSSLGHAESLQVGAMYAENIEGVGLYLGLEAENFVYHASGYIDATLLVSNAYDAEQPFFGGASVGLRTAFDTPLSPYVGIGVYLGQNEKEVSAEHDKKDNDGDGFIDERGEMRVDNTLMSAVYPELGWRIALGDSVTVRLMGRYMVSSFGRQHDDWFYGLSLAFNQ